jgi:hypothetical protein
MKVRAIAAPAERSNAVGTVELECTPAGLALVYLSVAAFSDGYAPGALASDAQLIVPWTSVREARVEGEQIFLALDPAITPHHRLTLVNFSGGDTVHHREVYRQRVILRIGATGAALVSLLVVAFTVPRIAPRTSALTALLIGAATALAVLAVGLFADRRVATGGADSGTVREALVAQLSLFLPGLVRGPRPPRPPPKLPSILNLQGILPRTTLAIVITLTATMLGLVLVGRWIVSGEREQRHAQLRAPPAARPKTGRPPPPPVSPAPPSPAAAPPRPPAATPEPSSDPAPGPQTPALPPSSEVALVTGACQCGRSDCALWADPVPKLSTLLLSRRARPKGRHTQLELDIAAVNNSDREIRELSMMVQFYEQDPPPSLKKYPVSHRAVYYEGPLGPGQAVKWSIEARGTEYEILNPIEGDVGPRGEEAAPTNLLAQLLDANHRPVRLHGAMMLAFLADPRAREGTLKLRDALREDEAPYLERLLLATGDVRTCRLRVSEGGRARKVQACVFNASAEAKPNLGLRVRGLAARIDHQLPVEPPPLVAAEATWKLAVELQPGTGAQVAARLDLSSTGGQAPAMFEAYADRIDLLR